MVKILSDADEQAYEGLLAGISGSAISYDTRAGRGCAFARWHNHPLVELQGPRQPEFQAIGDLLERNIFTISVKVRQEIAKNRHDSSC